MANRCPYLFRRRNTLHFRIAVPVDLQDVLGLTEVTQSLGVQIRRDAEPLTLRLAAFTKQTFQDLRRDMATDPEKTKLKWRVKQLEVQADLKRRHAAELEAQMKQRNAHQQGQVVSLNLSSKALSKGHALKAKSKD